MHWSKAPKAEGHARWRGFTLIELMVVVALMALILLATVPLATDWVHSAQTRDARSRLEQGYGLAKALALRNPCRVPNDDPDHPAVTLDVSVTGAQAKASVNLPGDASTCDFLASSANPQWSAQLPPGVVVSIGGVAAVDGTPRSLGVSNRGTPNADPAFKTSKGSDANDETGHLQ